MKNSKNGWYLLIVCFIFSFLMMGLGTSFGSSLNGEAGDIYGIIGANIGFMMPPIVYFGNKLG